MKTARILGIETHQYAPELNEVHFANGVRTRAPGIRGSAGIHVKNRENNPKSMI